MPLGNAQQYVLSPLTQAPDKHDSKVWRDGDNSSRMCALDDNGDYKVSGLEMISHTTFNALHKQCFTAKAGRTCADMECRATTRSGKLALTNAEK